MKVFIGSSSTMKKYAEQISLILRDNECEPVNWWEHPVTRKNPSLVSNLIQLFSTCDAGLFLFSEDDPLTIPDDDEIKMTRDNVIFEYGLFYGMHGAEKTTILKSGNPQLPVDPADDECRNLKYDKNEDYSTFKKENTGIIQKWVTNTKNEAELKLTKRIIQSLKNISNKLHPNLEFKIEELILSLQGKEAVVNYNEKKVMTAIQGYLQNGIAKSIFGIDVVGPKGWQSPSIYHYLAPQLREYLRKNLNSKGQFHLKMDERLFSAVECAITNAKKFRQESYTEFDNISENFELEKVTSLETELQYCRILLWSKAELLRPETLAVIRFHEAFRIPLFYLEFSHKDNERYDDFLFIEDGKRTCLCCCNSTLATDYKDAEAIVNNGQINKLSRRIERLLKDERILFAEDARLIYGQPSN